MKKKLLNIVAVQCDLQWEDLSANFAFVKEVVEHHAQNADLLIFPEMFLTGYTMNTRLCAVSMNSKEVQSLSRLAIENRVAIAGSLSVEEDATCFNRFLWLDPSGSIQFYDKKHLFTYAKEQEHYTAGSQNLVVAYKGWNIACFICYDLRFPVWTRNANVDTTRGYDVAIFVANWPAKRSSAWSALLKARAIENQSYVVGVNRTGVDGNQLQYNGDSVVLDWEGNSIGLELKDKGGSIIKGVLSEKELLGARTLFPVLNDADKFEIK